MKAATRMTCKSFIVALVVAAAVDVEVAKRAAPPKPYGGVHLRLEDDLRGYVHMRHRLGVRTNFELMARTKALEACAAGSTKLYVAVGLDVSDRPIAASSPQICVHDVGAQGKTSRCSKKERARSARRSSSRTAARSRGASVRPRPASARSSTRSSSRTLRARRR